ncbi:MAG: hypothetical protein ACLGJC_21310 [Alphaproteobacteria bacterium]
MFNGNFPMVGGLATQGASVRPQQLATGGMAYAAPPAGFDPSTYGQGGNGGWLFWKPPAPAVAPTPDPMAQPTGGMGGLGGGPMAWHGGDGGAGGGAPQQNINGREWYSDRPTGYAALNPDTYAATMGGDHDGSVGGTSTADSFGGFLSDTAKSIGAVIGGPLGMLGIGLGIANNRDNLSFVDALKDGLYGLRDSLGLVTDHEGDGSGNSDGFGGNNGMAGDPGHGTGDPGSAYGATGGLLTPRGFRKPLARGGLASSGLILGSGGGQDDRVPMTIPADSYVIPADVVSGLGDGNPEEGARRLHRAVGGPAPMGGLSRPGVPVAVSPAEQVIPPERVAALGGGDTGRGEKALDGFIRNVRKHKTSKGAKHPPKAHPADTYMPRGGKR